MGPPIRWRATLLPRQHATQFSWRYTLRFVFKLRIIKLHWNSNSYKLRVRRRLGWTNDRWLNSVPKVTGGIGGRYVYIRGRRRGRGALWGGGGGWVGLTKHVFFFNVTSPPSRSLHHFHQGFPLPSLDSWYTLSLPSLKGAISQPFNHFTPTFKKYILTTFKEKMYEWVLELVITITMIMIMIIIIIITIIIR